MDVASKTSLNLNHDYLSMKTSKEKHKQLINLVQLQCKIQNPINLKMNRK